MRFLCISFFVVPRAADELSHIKASLLSETRTNRLDSRLRLDHAIKLRKHGTSFGLAIGSDGNVYAWGLNSSGQLGIGTTTSSLTPVKVALPSGITAKEIFAGPAFSLAIGNDGNIYAWGSNGTGQLGNGTKTNSSVPVMVSMPSGVTATAISAGSSFSLAIGSDGNIYAWGGNGYGQLGNGTKTNSSVPVLVSMPSGVTGKVIAGGRLFSSAIGSDGKVYAWGDNLYGELANGTVDVPKLDSIPVAASMPGGVTATGLTAIRWSGYIIGSDNDVYSWGYNQEGELGIGTKTGAPQYAIGAAAVIPNFVLAQPGVPSLLSPANDAVNQLSSLVLKWSKTPNATEYLCQLSSDPTFGTNLVVNDSSLTDTSDTASGLSSGTKYYWRVLSENNGVMSAFSNTDSFTVVAIPATPVIVAPQNGATFQRADSLTFVWNRSTDATGYGLQVSDTVSFSTFVVNDSTADTMKVVTKLNNLQKYYWRVLAYSAAGASAYTATDSFTTRIAVPPSPGLVFPQLSTTGIPREVTFQWQPSTLASRYKIQIATDSQVYSSGDSLGYFTSPVFDTTVVDTSFQPAVALQPNTTYYWHVGGVDTAGLSGFSATWEFKTGTGLTAVNEETGIPKTFALLQNYPNPFNPTTVIKYSLPKAQIVTLKVYNVLGQEVATLVDARQNVGYYEVNFNADLFASGVYFYVLRTDNFSAVHKMMLLK